MKINLYRWPVRWDSTWRSDFSSQASGPYFLISFFEKIRHGSGVNKEYTMYCWSLIYCCGNFYSNIKLFKFDPCIFWIQMASTSRLLSSPCSFPEFVPASWALQWHKNTHRSVYTDRRPHGASKTQRHQTPQHSHSFYFLFHCRLNKHRHTTTSRHKDTIMWCLKNIHAFLFVLT